MPDQKAALERGKRLFGQKQYVAAEREFRAAIEAEPRNALCHAWLARTLERQKKHAEAIAASNQALALDTRCMLAYRARGNSFRARGEFASAIANYDRAISIAPNQYAWAYNDRGCTHREMGDLKRAIRDYQHAIGIDRSCADAYTNLGSALEATGDLGHALDWYNLSLKIDPKGAVAYCCRGNAHIKTGNSEQAIADFNSAIEYDPEFADAYASRGWHHVNRGELDPAIDDLSRAIHFDSRSASAYNNRGWAFHLKGDDARACRDYDNAIELDPTYATAYGNRALSRAKSGDLEGCLADQARYHKWNEPACYQDADARRHAAFRSIHKHLLNTLLPRLHSAGEQFVAYYPCELAWAEPSKPKWQQGTRTHGNPRRRGFGYLCLSDCGIHLASLREASRTLLKGPSIVTKAAFATVRQFDAQEVENSDQQWTLPYRSIQGVLQERDQEQGNEKFRLSAAGQTFVIDPRDDHVYLILAGIDMGRRGQFKQLRDEPASQTPATTTTLAT
jgi:tetratricopeptide (TPR) repeat protein